MTESDNNDDIQETNGYDSSSPEATAHIPKRDAEFLSAIKKRILFVGMCIFQILAFIFFQLSYSYLPLYNEDRDISTYWTGLILGASMLGQRLACIFLASIVIGKFSTSIILSSSFAGIGISNFLYSLVHFIQNMTVYKVLSMVFRFASGAFTGIINSTIFGSYITIYPKSIATVMAIGEAVVSVALALGPFLGGVLYDAGGFILASLVPSAMISLCVIPACFLPNLNSSTRKHAGGFIPASLVPSAMISFCAMPACFLPNLNSSTRKHETEKVLSWTSVLDPWVLFPLWNVASAQLLDSFHLPLISPYVKETFNVDVVWSGTAMLINKAVVCIFTPFSGKLMDKYGPCKMMIVSSVSLPLVYVCVGPLPLLSFVTPSIMQLILSMAFLGLVVPMGCISAMPIMLQVYKSRNHDMLPQKIANLLVSLYCASFPVGIFIGTAVSGFIEPYASFGWSTGAVGLIYIAQSLLCIGYCLKVIQSTTRSGRQQNGADPSTCTVLQNPTSSV